MARILVVEDERDIVDALEFNLSREGHTVVAAGRGAEALAEARRAPPDLILLDRMLPDVSGTDVLRDLKADARTRGVPVVMVTAKGEEIDRVVGFELGAEDYVVKPFSMRELMLRLSVILRRKQATAEPSDVVSFGPLRIDRGAHRVWVSEAELDLTPLEFKLLSMLVERRGRVQTREVLQSDVWGIRSDIATRTVDTHVKRLREKLGEAGAWVETVRGVGYRFVDEPPATTSRPPSSERA